MRIKDLATLRLGSYSYHDVVTRVNSVAWKASCGMISKRESFDERQEDWWLGLEDAFNDLADADVAVGGCNDFTLHPITGRLSTEVNLNPLEGSSTYALVSRLIASVTPMEELGARTRLLLQRYGSLKGLVLAAGRATLQHEVITERERAVLQTVRDVTCSFLRECSRDDTRIVTFSDLYKYLKLSLATEHGEVTKLIMLDRRSIIIADEAYSETRILAGQPFPKGAVARLVAHDAASVIIIHSQPSGEPEPTRQDITFTKRLAFLLNELSISFQDYVMVGRRSVISLRRLGLFDESG